MGIKARASTRFILIVMAIGLVWVAMTMQGALNLRTSRQSINAQNSSTRKLISEAIRSLSFIQAYIVNFDAVQEQEWLSVTEREFQELGEKLNKSHRLLQENNIESSGLDSIKEFYDYSKGIILSCKDYISMKDAISGLAVKITSTAKKLEDDSININQISVVNDIAKLNLTEKMYFLQKDSKAQSEVAKQISSLLDRIESGLQGYLLKPTAGTSARASDDLYGYLLYGQILEHKKVWLDLQARSKRLIETRANLVKDLNGLNNAVHSLRLALSQTERDLAASIEDNTEVIDENQKKAKMLTALIVAIFAIGIYFVISAIKVPTFKKPEPESKREPPVLKTQHPKEETHEYSRQSIPQPPPKVVQESVQPAPPQEPVSEAKPDSIAKIGTEDIKGLKKIMVNIIDLIYKDKNNFSGLTKEIYSPDNYIYNHSVNVAILAIRCGLTLGLDREKLVLLGMSALLHDIGLTKVPKDILDKPGKLTKREFSQIKKHPSLGLEILEEIPGLEKEIKYAITQHHERHLGQGYPGGLSEEDIHLFAKIIGLVDVYEALTHSRIYRVESLSKDEAINEIRNLGEDAVFDRHIISAFLKGVIQG